MTFTPTSATTTPVAAQLREYSRFTKEFVMDRPPMELFNLPSIAAAGPANLLSHGTANAPLAEINTSEICGLTFDASNDSHGILFVLPYWIDLDQDIDFRLLWSNHGAGAATGSALFTALYTPLAIATTYANGTQLAVGATALDSIIVNQVDPGTDYPIWTSWGTLTGGKSTMTSLTPGSDCLALKFAVTFTTVTDTTVYCGQYRAYRRYL